MTTFKPVQPAVLSSGNKPTLRNVSQYHEEIHRRIGEADASAAETLKRIGAYGNAASEMLKLSGGDYGRMRYNLRRIEFALKKGLNTDVLREAATSPEGRFYGRSYAILLLISDAEMRIPNYLRNSGITGARIRGALERAFGNDLKAMHLYITAALLFERREPSTGAQLRTEG